MFADARRRALPRQVRIKSIAPRYRPCW